MNMRKRVVSLLLSLLMVLCSFSGTGLAARQTAGAGSDDGLLLRYDFENWDGATVRDVSGNGFDGTLHGAPTQEDARGSKTIRFSTSEDYILVPIEVVKDLTDVTVKMDVCLEDVQPWMALYAVGSDTGNHMVMAAKGTDDLGWGFTMGSNINGSDQRVNSARENAVPVHKWVTLAYTQQGNDARLYINGVMVAQNTNMTNRMGGAYNENEHAYIAKSPFPSDPTAIGRVDNVEIYNRALSEDELSVSLVTDEEAVQKDAEALTLGDLSALTSGQIPLPLDGDFGSYIYWQTSDPEHLSENGIVSPSTEQDVTVTLTATVVYGEARATRTFEAFIPADPNFVKKEPIEILQIGDSNTEFGFLTMNMKDILDEQYGEHGTGFVTLNPSSFFAYKKPENVSFSFSGNWGEYDTAAWGAHEQVKEAPNGLYVKAWDAGSTLTVDFVGSAIDLYYLSWSGAGSFTVTIDGEDKGTVHQYEPSDDRTHKVSFDGLLYGRHQLVLRLVGDSEVNLYGMDIRVGQDGDRTAIHTFGNGEAHSGDYARIDETIFCSAIEEIHPDKVVVVLGTNDHGALDYPRPAADVQADLITILERIKKVIPAENIWLLSTFDTNDPSKNPESRDMLREYWKTSFPNAAEETGVNYWNMGEWFGEYDTNKMVDAWHVNERYGRVIMQELYEKLVPQEPAQRKGLVLDYRFDEAEGNVVVDSAGEFDGMLVGETARVDGFQDGAISLDGGYISVPNGVFADTEDVTISMWVKLNGDRSGTPLLAAGSSQENYMVLSARGNVEGRTCGLNARIREGSDPEDSIRANIADRVFPGTWTLVTYTQEGPRAKLYLNSEEVASDLLSKNLSGLSADGEVRIGADQIFSNPNANGEFESFRIYDYALSQEEIAAEVNAHQEKIEKELAETAINSIDLGDLENVSGDLTLPAGHSNGTVFIWSSDKPEFLSNDGEVTFPTMEQGDQTVTLTVTAKTRNGYELQKTFTVALTWRTAVSSVEEQEPVRVEPGTAADELGLPDTVEVELLNGGKMEIPVVWNLDAYRDQEGVYTLEGTLIPPEGISNEEGLTASITVEVKTIPKERAMLALAAPEMVSVGSSFEVVGMIDGLDLLENPVAGLQMIMTYPEGMTCTEVVPNEAIQDDVFYSIQDNKLEVSFGYSSWDLDQGLPVDLGSLFTAKFTASADMEEGDYTFGLKDVMLSDWNAEEVPYTAEGASVHVTELPKEPQLLTVQWSGNASMSVEGNAEEIISTDAIYGAKVQPGEELTFTFTPTDGAFSGAQLNGEDIEFAADGCTYTFTMPGESTTLCFTFTSVDKSILGIVLEEANAVPQDVIDSLVPSAKEFFENALAKAQEVYEDAAATEEEVKEAWSDLLDAMHLLEFEAGDKETLLPLINIAEQLKDMLDQFKPGTTEGFEEALDAAKDVYAEEDALKADVDEAYDNLQAAIDKLEMRADMSILQNTVNEANSLDLNSYIDDEAMAAFKTVLAEAEELLLNADADQADVDAKAVELSNAMAALRKIPNKDELNKLIAEMEQKDLDGYTDRSVAAFKAALSVAKTVAADETADGQAVAKAYTNLEAAANNLVKAEKPSTGNSGKGSTSANIGNAYGAAGVVSAAQGVTSQKAYVVSDTTVNFNLKRGSAYCFKMTVVNGNNMVPGFTVGNGEVLKTQFVAKIGNDYYYRVYATGTPGQSTGVYTTLPGQNAVKHCTVTIA